LFCTLVPVRIDLNADVGEAFGAYTIGPGAVGNDAGLLRSVTSANVAAGFHAGDPSVLRATIRAAKSHGVAVGAHPGFPDLVGFGRREMSVTPKEAEDFVLFQIAAVAGVAAAEGVRLQHVKPHGALFNMAARDACLATAIACATAAFDPALILFGLPGSEMLKAGRAAGLRVAAEAFADRAYEADGSLVSRKKPGAVINDAALVVSRAIRMATDKMVTAIDGTIVTLDVDTICVHGDTPGADDLASRLRAGLEATGVSVKAVGAD
jgi:5-oxoprolinase (ATP-hydrolysing) subunit A